LARPPNRADPVGRPRGFADAADCFNSNGKGREPNRGAIGAASAGSQNCNWVLGRMFLIKRSFVAIAAGLVTASFLVIIDLLCRYAIR
jgi:hypothetical protein